MKRSCSIPHVILNVYLLLMLVYVYASATGLSVKIIVLASLGALILTMLCARYISVERGEFLWLLAVLVMFIWTRRIDSDVLYYNIIFLLTISTLIVFQSRQLQINLNNVVKLFVGASFATVILVILELVFREKIAVLLRIFLPSYALNDELLYISARTGLRGLASSTNAVALAGFIVLTYSLFVYDNQKRMLRYLGLVTSLIALVVCGERSNFIFVPLAILLVYLLRNKNNKGFKYFKILFSVFSLLSVFVLIRPQLEQIPALKRTFRTLDMLQKGNEIAGERSILYNRACEMWKEKPLFGHGWFEFYYKNTGILKPGSNSHAHNLLFEALAELGAVGTVLLFIPIIYCIVLNYKLIRNFEKTKTFNNYYDMLCFVFGFQVFFILDSMLHLTFFSPRIILYLISLFILFYIKRRRVEIYEI